MKLTDFLNKKYTTGTSEPGSYEKLFFNFITSMLYIKNPKYELEKNSIKREDFEATVKGVDLPEAAYKQLAFLQDFYEKFFDVPKDSFINVLLEDALSSTYDSTKKFIDDVQVSNFFDAYSKIDVFKVYYTSIGEVHSYLINQGYVFSIPEKNDVKEYLFYKKNPITIAIKLCDLTNFYILYYEEGEHKKSIPSSYKNLLQDIKALL